MARKQAAMKTESHILPCHDHQRRTCIQVERVNGHVKYIPLDVGVGLEVQTMGVDVFDQRFTPMVDYPAEKACQLYLGYSQNIGATKEALDYLGQVVNISEQEFKMATAKKAAAPADEKRTAPRRATNGTKEPAKSGRRTTDPVVAPPKGKAAKPAKAPAEKAGEKRESAAQMFQDLIMAGKLTDDQIFEKVQEKFGLDEKKRGYVKWYRNHLKKLGKNPPEPKAAK
jgi:hypothetical protein